MLYCALLPVISTEMTSFCFNKLYVLFFLGVFSLLLSCNGAIEISEQKIGNDISLAVNPEQVTKEDVITLTFPKIHPKNIAIRAPDKKWYTIHEPTEGVILLPVEDYVKATSIKLNVGKIKGVVWIDGQKMTKAVFSVPGEYRVYMADNLETEPENTFFISKNISFK